MKKKNKKYRSSALHVWRLGFAATALVATSMTARAAGVPTTYNAGDLFIGFRQTGVANTLAVNIGAASKYLPTSLGGNWNGEPFQVTFGLVPNTTTTVTNLNLDLTAVFGDGWATNAVSSSQDVSWSVVGITSANQANVPISGFAALTAFLTKAETTPGVRSSTLQPIDNGGLAAAFSGFTSGISSSSYTGRISTNNSSLAYIGAGSESDNWNTRIGPATANSSFNSGRNAEQALSGPFAGPTNSVMDLYLAPGEGSTTTTARTYLGSFALNSNGQLRYGNFTAVPEPGSAVLFGLGAAGLSLIRRRKRASTPFPKANAPH